jgi:hypothetical protein
MIHENALLCIVRNQTKYEFNYYQEYHKTFKLQLLFIFIFKIRLLFETETNTWLLRYKTSRQQLKRDKVCKTRQINCIQTGKLVQLF